MRKLYWKNLPRPVKVLLLLIGAFITSLLLYIFIGAPPLSDEHRYRRAEKAHLVGPAEILDIIELTPPQAGSYERMLLADGGDYIVMYLWNTQNAYHDELVYRKKMGDVTVYAAPTNLWYYFSWEGTPEIKLPIVLFDNFPKAVRAELDFTLRATLHGDSAFSKDYSLEAHRETPGYFCSYIHAPGYSASDNDEGAVLASFSSFTSGEVSNSIYVTTAIPANIRLYNADDHLIHEETVMIRHLSAEAHYERGELPED